MEALRTRPRARLALANCALLVVACGSQPLASDVANAVPDAAPPNPFDVQGHRGARGLLPENTLPAFERAIELGVSTLELDLVLSSDDAVVVSHDPVIRSEVCRAPPSLRGRTLRARELTLAELQRFDCGALNPDPRRFPEPPRVNLPGERMPTLDQLFARVRALGDDETRFNLETKVTPEASAAEVERWVAAVVEVVRRHEMVERTTLQSFDWRALVIAERLEPGLSLAALLGVTELDPRWTAGLQVRSGEGIAEVLERLDAEVEIFSPSWRLLVPGRNAPVASVEALHAAGLRVIPWTVNDAETMERMIDLGVDGLISDRPDRLLEVLRRRGLEPL